MQKYELLATNIEIYGQPVFQIKALKTFELKLDVGKSSFLDKIEIKEGDLGGYVQSEDNLSQVDDSWIKGNSCVTGNSRVLNNSYVKDSNISGNVLIDSSIIRDSFILEDVVSNHSVINKCTIQNHTNIFGSDLTDLQITGSCDFSNTTLYGIDKFITPIKNDFAVENISGTLISIQTVVKNNKEINQLVIDEFFYYKTSDVKYIIDEKDVKTNSNVTKTKKLDLSEFTKEKFLWKLKFNSLVDKNNTKEFKGKTVYKLHTGGYITEDSDLLHYTGDIDEDSIIISSRLEGNQPIKNSMVIDSDVINTKILDSTVSTVTIENSEVHYATIKNVNNISKCIVDNITLQNILELYNSKIIGEYNFVFDGSFGEPIEKPYVIFSNMCLERFTETSFLVDISNPRLMFIIKPNEDSFYTKGYFYLFSIGRVKHIFTHILLERSNDQNYIKIDSNGTKVVVKNSLLTPLLQKFYYTNLSAMKLIHSNIPKKYELLKNNFVFDNKGNKVYQIKALMDFGEVKKGELGGYISEDVQLDMLDDSWVDEDSIVSGKILIKNSLIKNSKIYIPYMKDVTRFVPTKLTILNSKIFHSTLTDAIGLIEDSSITTSIFENYIYLKEACSINVISLYGIIVEPNCKILDKEFTQFKYITKNINKKNEVSIFNEFDSIYLSGYLDKNDEIQYNLFILEPNSTNDSYYSVMHIQKNVSETLLPSELNSYVSIIKENLRNN